MSEIPAEAAQAATRAMVTIYAGYESDSWTATDEEAGRAAVEAAAPFIAEHALRTATLRQHEEMIGRIATEAIKRERPKLLAAMERATDQAMEKRAAAIRADERARIVASLRENAARFRGMADGQATIGDGWRCHEKAMSVEEVADAIESAGAGSPTTYPSVASESTESAQSPSAAPVYPPAPARPAESLTALRERYAAAIANADCDHEGYREYLDTCPACRADAVLAVRDDELARALRIADYHAGLHRQAADVLARLFPSIECVLIDHADELDDEQGQVDANLAELAHVYRELTGFDARAAVSEEQTGGDAT